MNEGIFENDDDNFNEVESEDIDVPQQELFTIKSNYNSSEVNKIMKSSTKLFSDISPLFTETLTSFKNDGARKNLTLITNDSSNIRSFSDYFTIVNPGSAQGSGHGYVNFTNGNLFAFACSD